MTTSERPTTVWLLGDQIMPHHSALESVTPDTAVILMIESQARARQLPYHKQKLVLMWSAMRHFAEELRAQGYTVDYYEAQPNLKTALARHICTYSPQRVRLMQANEYGADARLAALVEAHHVTCESMPTRMFLSRREDFKRLAEGKKTLVMETFYRHMRRQTGLLMNGRQPEGGKWNYDRQNRQRPPRDHRFPAIPHFPPDAITPAVIELVTREFPDHFGDLDTWWLRVTRRDADRFVDDFLTHRLDLFGPYEDAIVWGQRALYHSLLSPLLNLGLVDPLDVCQRAEARYHDSSARRQSVEGFIRQIIGWREFIYQVYHRLMLAYADRNHFAADLPLPAFYWTGDTDMTCIADAVTTLHQYGLNHHIQRLMVTGNVALLAGIDPQAVNDWYWLAYVDAYGWVVTPNVFCMTLYADGGILATKPYAASANYINKMSDCCSSCHYDPRQTTGETACPFNVLYWDFLDRNADALRQLPRMNLVMGLLDKRDADTMEAIRLQAGQIKSTLRTGGRL